MKGIHERVRTVLGLHFLEDDALYEAITKEEKRIYLIYSKKKETREAIASIQKCMRMIGWSYRICLLDINEKSRIGFLIYYDENEWDETVRLLEWIAGTHNHWSVTEYTGGDLRITGLRIANNMFHEKRLLLQGEILD